MYAATKKSPGATRVVGIVMVVLINAIVAYALANGIGSKIVNMVTKTEVVVIEEVEVLDEEPPPPPPPDLDLPPPPPQVVLPEFTFDVPPPPNAIQQVQQVVTPAPRPAVAPPPPAPRVVLPSTPPKPDTRRFAEMLSEDYPPRSLRAKEEGVVTVSMCVDERGRISDVKLVRTSGFPLLDEATVKNLPKVRMSTPAKDSDGKPMAWCSPPYQLDVQWQLPGR